MLNLKQESTRATIIELEVITQGQIFDVHVKCEKSPDHNKTAILNFFQPLLNLSENCLLVTCMHNKFEQEHLKLSRPQGQIIDGKCEKSQ